MRIGYHTIYVPGADSDRDRIVEAHREMGSCIHEDPDRRGCMWNWLRAIRCAALNDAMHGKDWTVILSDDALPLAGWREHLPLALEHSPEDILGLTHFGGYGQAALKKDAPYGVGRLLIWGGAVAIRGSVVVDLAKFAHTYVAETGYQHDDGLMALFQAHRGKQTAMVSRAIFGQPVKQSLLGHNTPIREPNTTIANISGPPYDNGITAKVSRGSKAKFEGRMSSVRRVFGTTSQEAP